MSFWKRKEKPAPPPAPPRPPVTIESLSPVIRQGLEDVQDAANQCSQTRGNEFVAARQRLRQVRDESLGEIESMVSDEPPDSRLRRMAHLTMDEIREMAGHWLSLKATVAHRVPMTTEELSELQREMWHEAEQAAAACGEARGRELKSAQKRLRRIVDEATDFKATLNDESMSKRQALMWKLAIEELTDFAGKALAGQRDS